jgi:hypothetical protein
MISALRDNEVDIAVGLTEGWVAGLGSKKPSGSTGAGTAVPGDGYRLVGTYVNSPLVWGVNTGRGRQEISSLESLKGGKCGISRYGR